MKLLLQIPLLILASFTLSANAAGIVDLPAKHSPESVVTCASAGTHLVLSRSVADGINADLCRSWSPSNDPDPCAPCITSLEVQGCMVIDVVTTNAAVARDEGVELSSISTYMLSCAAP